MKEIGSEFWLTNNKINYTNYSFPKWLEIGEDNKLLLSGRTAIHFILKDIQKNKRIKRVYFPSYSCQSMLQPFIDFDIEVVFYEVNFDNELSFNINVDQDCDIFFAMNYFGFEQGRMDKYIEAFKKRDIIVIEDTTHSLLSDTSHNPYSDYLVVSLRKWFPIISGGLAVKTIGKFKVSHKQDTNINIIDIRKSAMLEKGRYIENINNISKSSFLDKYRVANEKLKNDYQMYSIDRQSYKILCELDINEVKRKRRQNACFIYRNLARNNLYDFVFHELQKGDYPIFVPIYFSNRKDRDTLRKYLINKNIYFPVHWPKPKIFYTHGKYNISDFELSFVIDQRYDVDDMEYVIRRIVEFYE